MSMTREELVNALIDWDLGPCSEAAAMLQRDGEAIAALEAERDQLVAALRIIAGYDPGHNQGDDRSIAIRALRGESTCPG